MQNMAAFLSTVRHHATNTPLQQLHSQDGFDGFDGFDGLDS
jgi:hypothetical protein